MISWPKADPDAPSLWRDLRSGDAGWLPRIGLSFASAGGILAIVFCGLGLADLVVRMSDGMIAIGVGLGAAAWCIALGLLWSTYGRAWKALKTIFGVVGVWAVSVPVAIMVDELPANGDFFIGAIVALALGTTVLLIATLPYRRGGGKALVGRDGVVDVLCPECGYSLVGISQCLCPECGTIFTIDELIRRQHYRTERPQLPPASTRPSPPAAVEPPAALPIVAHVDHPGARLA